LGFARLDRYISDDQIGKGEMDKVFDILALKENFTQKFYKELESK
jgi:hypothetical protein